MSNQHTDRVARVERRKTVARLYLKGWTQVEIAEKLGKAQGTISNDLQIVQKEWRRSAVRAFEARHAIELRKMDALERELWEAWEGSLQPTKKVSIRKDRQTGEEIHTSNLTYQNGDPRFLALVQKCVVVRGAMLQPRASQEPYPNAECDLRVRRDRIIAVALALRERKRLEDDRERADSGEPGAICHLDEPEQLPAPEAPPAA